MSLQVQHAGCHPPHLTPIPVCQQVFLFIIINRSNVLKDIYFFLKVTSMIEIGGKIIVAIRYSNYSEVKNIFASALSLVFILMFSICCADLQQHKSEMFNLYYQ